MLADVRLAPGVDRVGLPDVAGRAVRGVVARHMVDGRGRFVFLPVAGDTVGVQSGVGPTDVGQVAALARHLGVGTHEGEARARMDPLSVYTLKSPRVVTVDAILHHPSLMDVQVATGAVVHGRIQGIEAEIQMARSASESLVGSR